MPLCAENLLKVEAAAAQRAHLRHRAREYNLLKPHVADQHIRPPVADRHRIDARELATVGFVQAHSRQANPAEQVTFEHRIDLDSAADRAIQLLQGERSDLLPAPVGAGERHSRGGRA